MDGEEFETVQAHDVERIRPDAVGEPGQRRFRVLVLVNGTTTVIWMEKEQVRRLAELFHDIAERVPPRGEPTAVAPTLAEFDETTDRQFRAGRMELSYDEEDDRLVIIVYDIDAEEEQVPSIACRLTRDQAREFAEEAVALVAAGRPLCPMCGQPMGPGPHVCEQQNGHFPHRLGIEET
jgi:uncharacterized repeat protein (TIGR03847 family)